MFNKQLLSCLLAIGLLAMAFGTVVKAEPAGPSGISPLHDVSSQKKMPASVVEQLTARGATMVPKLTLPRRLSVRAAGSGAPYVCHQNQCGCKGVKACLALTDKICKAFRCTNAGGEPICICDL